MGKHHEAFTPTRVRTWGCDGIGQYDQQSIGSGHESETCSVDHQGGHVQTRPITLSHSMSGQTNGMLGWPPTSEKGGVDSFEYDESGHKNNDVNLTMH